MVETNDPVNLNAFLAKYGGICWYDPDDKCNFIAHSNKMHFNSVRKDKGYCVIGLKDGYDTEDEQAWKCREYWEPWHLNDDLYECIVEYYDKNPQPNLRIVKRKDDSDTEGDDSSAAVEGTATEIVINDSDTEGYVHDH